MIGHEKHKNQVAWENDKAPIGAREASNAAETSLVFFVAKGFGGLV